MDKRLDEISNKEAGALLMRLHKAGAITPATQKGAILLAFVDEVKSKGALSDTQFDILKRALVFFKNAVRMLGPAVDEGPEIKTMGRLSCFVKGKRHIKAVIPMGLENSAIGKRAKISLKRIGAMQKEHYWLVPFSPFNIWTLFNTEFTLSDKVMARLEAARNIKPLEAPPGILKTPRPYQMQAVRRLIDLEGNALLADEQGLGKTVEIILWAAMVKPETVVIVCPASAKYNWANEIKDWVGAEPCFVCEGREPAAIPKGAKWVIINPAILKQWARKIKRRGFDVLVVDEGHFLCNEKTTQTTVCEELATQAKSVILATGTPTDRKVIKLYQLIKFIDGGTLFPSKMRFGERYCEAKKSNWHKGYDYNGATNLGELHRILKDTLMIRRTKEEVAKELPAKSRGIVRVKIAKSAMAEYIMAEEQFREWLKLAQGKGMTKGQAKAEAMLKINYLKHIVGRAKVETAIDWISNYLENEQKLVVFAVHKDVLGPIYQHFKKRAVIVDGNITGINRQKARDDFQNNPKINLFCGQLIAASEAITLTAAKDTLTVELDWRAIKHSQAEDRVHRIGQNRPVTAYYMIALDTVEIQIMKLLDENLRVMAGVIDGKEVAPMGQLETLFNMYLGGETWK
jgi:SNF2 family DNA or RNA helicase